MKFQLIFTSSLLIWQIGVFGGVILRDVEEIEICDSEDCHNTANHILKWLNPEIDPCEDFNEFTCGNWKKLPINERQNLSFGARNTLEEKFIPALLTNPEATNGNKHFEKLRNFMITCMDKDTINYLGVEPIKQLIQKAGGWPVLDAGWSEDDWDFVNAETALGGALVYVGTSYYKSKNSSEVTYLIDLGRPSLVRLYRPSDDQLVEGLRNESTKAYYDRIVEVAVALGANKAVAEQAMQEVLEFETAFVQKLKQNTYNSSQKVVKFKDLQEAVPWINLTKLLDVYLPASFELLPELMVLARKEYFLVLEEFINEYPTKTFANYIITKSVYPLLKYVHHDLKLPDEKDYGYKGNSKNESRFDYCIDKVKDGSWAPAMAAYLGIMYNDSSKVAREITKIIIEEFTKEVDESDWLDQVTREEAVKNISKIKIDVGFPSKILDLNELDKLYEGHDIDTSNFFDAIIYDKIWKIQRDFYRLHIINITGDVEEQMGWRYYRVKGLYISAHFVPEENVIDISGPFLYDSPLFYTGNPAYVNYGHVGTIVAHELIHAVDFNVRVQAAPEEEYHIEMERWGNNQTKTIYNQKKQCFIDFYSSINDTETTQLKLHGNFTQREDMADNGGLKVSLRAYRKLADQLGSPERKLPGLQQYTAEQVFMISMANAFCEIPDRERRIRQLEYDSHSPLEFRIKGMMMNSPDFSKIFNCDKTDPMNPPNKCEVW